jgi:c-di-GMP-related signal transduction protein
VSLLDAVFDMPLGSLLDQLAVPQDVAAAVLGNEGVLGALLQTAVAYERGVPGVAPATGVPFGVALDAYVRAVQWADETVTSLTTWGDGASPTSRSVVA